MASYLPNPSSVQAANQVGTGTFFATNQAMTGASPGHDAAPVRDRLKTLLRDNGLSLVSGGLFLIFAVGTMLAGAAAHNAELVEHGRAAISLRNYLSSGHYLEAVFENWESEFLQMGVLVLLTVRLFQRGSAESNDPDLALEEPRAARRTGLVHELYERSLSLALLTLFATSFLLHGIHGLRRTNAEHALHGEAPMSLVEYVTSAQFWYESFQNWQSEFLAVLAIVVLSIFLRQRGSAQSKRVSAPHSATGR